jgi:hypothetical protein
MKSLGSIVMTLLVSVGLIAGCHDECGAGYEPSQHLCRAVAQEGFGGEGGGDAAGAAGTMACEASTFAQACLTAEDCECDADFCAGYPGEEGICTRTGCGDDPSVCPSDWNCMDLSPFGPDLPTICTPP